MWEGHDANNILDTGGPAAHRLPIWSREAMVLEACATAARGQPGPGRRRPLLRDWLASDECDLTRIVCFEENYVDALASNLDTFNAIDDRWLWDGTVELEVRRRSDRRWTVDWREDTAILNDAELVCDVKKMYGKEATGVVITWIAAVKEELGADNAGRDRLLQERMNQPVEDVIVLDGDDSGVEDVEVHELWRPSGETSNSVLLYFEEALDEPQPSEQTGLTMGEPPACPGCLRATFTPLPPSLATLRAHARPRSLTSRARKPLHPRSPMLTLQV